MDNDKSSVFDPLLFEDIDCNLCGSPSSESDVIYEAKTGNIPGNRQDFIRIYSSASTDVFFERLLRCRKCGLKYLSPRPRIELILDGYSAARDEEYISQETGRLLTFRKAVASIKKIAPSGRLLDIGAASGIFVKAACDAGYEASGVEPSRWLCEFASRRYGVKMHSGTLDELKPGKESFDIVTIFDALEHMPDPMSVIIEIKRILKPGGILVINYPNIDDPLAKLFGRKWWFLLSVHLFYFTPPTLSGYMDKAGLKVLKHRPYIQRLNYSYLVKRLSVYSEMLAGIAKLPCLVPGLGDFLIPYFASQYLMIARKEE